MKKVIILILKDCSKCKALKNKLDFFNNSFKYYPCDENDDLCDQVESLAGVSTYPMVILLNINDEIKEIIYFTEDYDKIEKKEQIVDGIIKIGVYSIDQLINYIIKL